jgi:hypothetical protein
MAYNKLFINLACLALYREISDLGLFVQTSPYGLGLYKENIGPILLCKDLALS